MITAQSVFATLWSWAAARRVDVIAALAAGLIGSVSALIAFAIPELAFAGLVSLGVALGVLALMTFLRSGGNSISVAGMLSFGIFVFGGFAAVYLGLDLYPPARTTEPIHTVSAAWMLLLVQVGLTIASAARSAPPVHVQVSHPPVRDHAIFAAVLLGLSIGSVIARNFSQSFDLWAAGFGSLGFLVLVDLALTRRDLRSRLAWGSAALIAAAFYATAVFQGQGRLTLASLAASALVLVALIWNGRLPKLLWAVATPVALIAFSLQRLQFFVDEYGAHRAAHEGIGSVIVPLVSTGRIVDALATGQIQPTWGYELWAALTIWVPRPLWPDKPRGFGKDMISVTQPEAAANPEASSAAVLPGEFLWDWGLVGWVVCAALLIAVVVLIDRTLGSLASVELERVDTAAWIRRVAYAVMVGSALNFVWSGSYTWLSRALIPLVLTGAALAVTWWVGRRNSVRAGTH